jgi:hypothetical protein
MPAGRIEGNVESRGLACFGRYLNSAMLAKFNLINHLFD